MQNPIFVPINDQAKALTMNQYQLSTKVFIANILLLIIHIALIGSCREGDFDNAPAKMGNIDARIKARLVLAEKQREFAMDSCKVSLHQVRKMFYKTNAMPFLGEYFELLGDISRSENRTIEAIRLYKIAAFSYKYMNEDKRLGNVLNALGILSIQAYNISGAFRYYLRAKEISEAIHDTGLHSKVCNNIGIVYINSNRFAASIEFFKKALVGFESERDSLKIGKALLNLGEAYISCSMADSARYFSNKAISIFTTYSRTRYLGSAYLNIARSFNIEKKYGESVAYLSKALNIAIDPAAGFERGAEKFFLAETHVNLGVTYYLNNNLPFAYHHLNKGYQLADSLGFIEMIVDASGCLSKYYDDAGSLDSSYYYYKRFTYLYDSLQKVQSINIVTLVEVQTEYQKEVREKQLQLVNAKEVHHRNIAVLTGAIIAFLAFTIILILRLRIEKHKKRQSELEKQAADIKLEVQNKELALNVMSLIRKNEFILDISNQLIRIEETMVDEKSGTRILNLVNTMQRNTDGGVWEEFELRFKQVHSSFYDQLLERFPLLTNNDLKLCALLKLNLSTKDMCELLGQRPATLDVARHRIRKKLGIVNSKTNLVTFLSQF